MNVSVCPHCGAQNRLSARYCANCRALLTPQPASQTCPQCHHSNRINARFCAACGYAFTPNKSSWLPAWLPPQLKQPGVAGIPLVVFLGSGLVLALLLCVTGLAFLYNRNTLSAAITPVATTVAERALAPTATAGITMPTANPTAIPSPTNTPTPVATFTPVPNTPTSVPAGGTLDLAQRATVRIIVPIDARPGVASVGSGSVITKRGHILTNDHLFVDDNGNALNKRSEIHIAFAPASDPQGDAVPQYRAQLVHADTQNDLALLVITAREDGSPLPADLGLGVMPIGDSNTSKLGDQLFILGYPALGGDTLTLTRGIISGFLPDDDWIKTDAEINPGNSGGSALNAEYELVGIASAGNIGTKFPGKIGLIRPVNVAQPLIAEARRAAGE